MLIKILRAVDDRGHIILSPRIRPHAKILENYKNLLCIHYENGVLYVWNPRFYRHIPSNAKGIRTIYTDTYNRLTIPKEIRDMMGILPNEKITCICQNGVLQFQKQKPTCIQCHRPIEQPTTKILLCLVCIRYIRAMKLADQ